jgi:hypothetical protein
MKKFVTSILTVFMSFTIFAGVSNSATLPANNGYGWKIGSYNGTAYGLKHNFTYTIKFESTKASANSYQYMQNTVNYLNAMPEMKTAKTKFIFSPSRAAVPSDLNNCGSTPGIIIVAQRYRPTGKKDYSVTWSRFDGEGLAVGGCILMDSEYKYGSSNTSVIRGLRNIHAHEFGHILGLKHPVYFSSSTLRPVMTDPAGGYQNYKTAGKYPEDDTRGIRVLIKNGS